MIKMSVDQSYAYAYQVGTGIYVGMVELLPDPLCKSKYQLWKDCTIKIPPQHKEGYVIRFNKEKDDWEYVENHIGEKGYLNDQPYEIKTLGPLPEGFSYTQSEIILTNNRLNYLDNLRKIILTSTDYLVMPDYELDEEDKINIINFRKQIRNLDKEDGYPWIDKEIKEILPKWPLKNKKCPYNV